MTSASLLIVLFVGCVIGAMTGLVVGGNLHVIYLALLAGFLGAIVGAVIRDRLLTHGVGVGPDDCKTPVLVLVYAVIASMAGSLAAKEVTDVTGLGAPVWLGTLAGLFSSVLLSMLLITYHAAPGEPPKLRRHAKV